MTQWLEVATGDDNGEDRVAPGSAIARFSIACSSDDERVTFRFGVVERAMESTAWPSVLGQVGERSPSRWQSPTYPAPLGTTLRPIVAELTSTPRYQLFLAGFEIAQTLKILKHDWDDLFRLGNVLSDISITIGRRDGLYFAPIDWYATTSAVTIDELLAANKVARLTARSTNGARLENVYIPYATPITLAGRLSPAATAAWNELRVLRARETVVA